MVALMERMQTSIDKLTQPEGNLQLNTGQAPTFVTPPPRTSSNLSPIPEVSTPQDTPPTQNPPPFPPTLGRLTPAQLPLPPSTQDARQKAVSTESELIVSTSTTSSSRQIHIQRINPTTQPHYYQPTTQNPTPPLHPTTTQTNQNPSHNTQPQPSYSQPLHQTMPYTHSHSPNQSFPQNCFQPQHTNNDLHLRTPHVELPIFTGDAPRAWLLECEDVFNLVEIPMANRVKWGLAHIRGQAKTWINSSELHLQQ
jgi:hypothetical protein